MEQIGFPPLITTLVGREPLGIASVQEAWTFLVHDWPEGHEELRDKALTMCDYALRGTAGTQVARSAFILAARDAGITVREPR